MPLLADIVRQAEDESQDLYGSIKYGRHSGAGTEPYIAGKMKIDLAILYKMYGRQE